MVVKLSHTTWSHVLMSLFVNISIAHLLSLSSFSDDNVTHLIMFSLFHTTAEPPAADEGNDLFLLFLIYDVLSVHWSSFNKNIAYICK